MAKEFFRGKIRFDRNEFAGSFGDIGTVFPLIASLILVCKLDAASVLCMFGGMQILTGFVYGIPMPVQPLKAMAVIVITQKLSGNILYGGGLAVGIMMLLLTLSGSINWISRVVPKSVVRGIQFGLGLQLAMLALKEYVPAGGMSGYVLAAGSFFLIIFLMGNKRYPAALFVILLGVTYALLAKIDVGKIGQGIGLHWPQLYRPTTSDITTGFFVLALPQLFLSIGNSILASQQAVHDYFPEKRLTANKLSLTYSLMNLVSPFLSGIPLCHGSGGIAGHYAFGARTGGSVVIFGLFYLIGGLFFSQSFAGIIEFFPKAILGIILLFEGWAMMKLIADKRDSKIDLGIIFFVGLAAVGLPYGYLIGLVLGTLLSFLVLKKVVSLDASEVNKIT